MVFAARLFKNTVALLAVMDWVPVQGVPRLAPGDCRDKLRPTVTLYWMKWLREVSDARFPSRFRGFFPLLR